MTTGQAVMGTSDWQRRYPEGTLAPEQFGPEGVATGVADAICGPVAAVAFARAYGRNPTVAEALDIARRNGRWAGEMQGPPSEKALLDDMGIPNRLEPNPSRDAVIRDVQNGNPVIVSSAGHYHYFVITGYDPETGLFDTGNTGLVFKNDKRRWRSWDDLSAQAALFIDEPSSPTPSTASDMSPQQGTPAVASGTAPADLSSISVQGRLAPQDFVNTLLPVAQAHSARTGIPVSYYLAAAAHEGGWGGAGNMLFGIKGPGTVYQTYEVEDGVDVPQAASFRDYPSADAAFSDFDQLVTGGRYAGAYAAFRQSGDPAQFFRDITAAGYATDRTWGDKIARMATGTIDPLLGTAAAVTTPGGTPTGTSRPTSAGYQPQFNTDVSVGGNRPATTSPADTSDPWALLARGQQALDRTVQDTRDRLARMGRGAADTAGNLNQGAIDTLNAGGDALVSEVSRPHPLSGLVEQGLASGPATAPALAAARALMPEETRRAITDTGRGLLRGLLDQPDYAQPLADPAMEAEAQRVAAGDRTGNPRALEYARSAVMSAFGTFGAADLEGGANAATRMYHGTGSAFDTPAADKFDPNGLFGPGYYLTDEPRVATSYSEVRSNLDVTQADIDRFKSAIAENRVSPEVQAKYRQVIDQFENPTSGPNVRAVDVPAGLRLLDADAPVVPEELAQVRNVLDAKGQQRLDLLEQQEGGFGTGMDLYQALRSVHSETSGKWPFGPTTNYPHGIEEASRTLQRAGYDGIRYAGGKRIPMADAAGNPIEHTAVVVFPESLPKIRNALSGRAGGQVSVPYAAVHGASTALGGAAGFGYGAATAPEGSTPQERIQRGLQYAPYGAAAGFAAGVPLGLAAAKAGVRAAVPETAAMRKFDAAFTSKGYDIPQGPATVRAAQGWSDDLKALKAMQDRVQRALGGAIPEARQAYQKARLSRAVQGKVERRFEEIGDILRPVRRDIKAVRTAWYAERLKELQGRFDPSMQGTYELPNGLTPADIDRAVLDTQRAIGPARWAAVQDAVKGLRGVYERQLDRMVDTGMMTAARRDAMRAANQFYAPMKRASWIADHVITQGMGTGSRDVFSVADDGLRALSETGSTRKVLDPFVQMERDVARTESMLARNDVARTVHEWEPELPGFFKEIPDGTPVPPGWGTFSYIKDGRKVRVGAEKWFTDAMVNLTPKQATFLGQLARVATLPLRLGAVTLNYGFALANLPRDYQAVLVNQGLMPHWLAYGLASAVNARLVPRALRNEGLWKTYLDYLESGAAMSGMYETVGRPGASLRRAAGIPSAGERAMDILRLPVDILRTPGELSELTTRIGTFAQKRARGQSMQSAAMASREGSFDMQKAGTNMRVLSQAVPFINARQQSVINTLTRLRDDPATRARFLLFSALPAMALLAYNTRDEASRRLYDDVPDYEKRDYHVLVVGRGENEDGSPSPRRVVIPKDNSQKLAGAVTEGMYQALIRHDPSAWAAMAAELAGDVVPTGTVDPIEAGMQLMPPPVRAGAEWAANYDYFRRRNTVPLGQQDLEKVAPELTFGPRTTETAKELGREFRASPRKIEQALRTGTGGFGLQALEATDTARRVLGGGPLIPAGGGVPLASKFVRDYGGQVAQDQADAYRAEVQRRVDAGRVQLEQTPQYQAADDKGKASMVTSMTARIESDTKREFGAENLPSFLEPPRPDGPPKYDPRILPPAMRAQYQADPYQLQRDIQAALDAVAAYKRDPRTNPRPTQEQYRLAILAKYPSAEWSRWNARTRRPAAAARRGAIEGAAAAGGR